MAWNTALVSVGSPVLPATPCKRDPSDASPAGPEPLPATLAAVVMMTNRGLLCLPSLPLAECNHQHQVLSALEQTLSVKYTANVRKMQLLGRTSLTGKFTKRELVLF